MLPRPGRPRPGSRAAWTCGRGPVERGGSPGGGSAWRSGDPRASRRSFLRRALALLVLPAAAALDRMVGRADSLPEVAHRWVSVELPPGDGVRLAPGAIVVRGGGRIHVFSSACPHLGCRIDRVDDGAIACPCHGSRFGLDGAVLRGPARRPLRALPYRVLPGGAAVRVRIDA
jgi:nitrite reductase/ring-hydroxylating ferredoxin subunit